jgi:hypothetical protein
MNQKLKLLLNKKGYFQLDVILTFLIISMILTIFFSFVYEFQKKEIISNSNLELNYLPVQICNLLVYSSGYPVDWEKNLLNLKSIGFKDPNNFSIKKEKLEKFSNINNEYYFFNSIDSTGNYLYYIKIFSLKDNTELFSFGKKKDLFKLNFVNSYTCYSIFEGEVVGILVEVWK